MRPLALLVIASLAAGSLVCNEGSRAEPVRAQSGIYNVRDYGAKGDGTTDDLGAINRALAAAIKGRIWFPAGSYLVSATISVSKPDITFSGVGTASRLVPRTAGFNLVTLTSEADRFEAHGLWFQGAAFDNSSSQFGIYTHALAAPDDVEIRDCFFGATSAVGRSLNSGVKIDGGSRWKVIENTFSFLQGAISNTGYGVLTGTHSHGTFAGNRFTGSPGHGRHAVYLSGGSSYNDVHTNYVNGFTEDAFPIYSQGYQTASVGNRVHHNTILKGGQATPSSAAISISGRASGNLVDSNYVDGFNANGIIVAAVGLAGVTDKNAVRDNRVYNVRWYGILNEGAQRTDIIDNDVRDAGVTGGGYSGIGIRSSGKVKSDRVASRGNICRRLRTVERCDS